jgi:glycosyltransferase involved in cell wall biosynthesis
MSKVILYLQYTNPAAYPPLEYSARIFAAKGWRCHFFGVASVYTKSFRFPDVPGIEVENLPASPRGWRMKLHYLQYMVKVWRRARRLEADWVYVSDPLAAPIGWILALSGYRVVYHEHDSPAGASPRTFFERMILWTRKTLARRADLLVFPQAERLQLFQESTGSRRPTQVVWNCPLREDASTAPRSARNPGDPLRVYFHGSINLHRVPLTLIEAAARCEFPIVLRIVGYETSSSQGVSEELRQAVAAIPTGHVRIELPGAMDRHRLHEQMRDAHVGWINGLGWDVDVNLKHLCGASNKPFDYLAAGLPLLVPDDPEWKRMYVDAGCALACDAKDPDSIAVALRWLYNHPDEAQAMGERGRQRILGDWNYESQFQPVIEFLEQSGANARAL